PVGGHRTGVADRLATASSQFRVRAERFRRALRLHTRKERTRMSATSPDPCQALMDGRARMGMWVFLGSELMFFGPVFFAYLYGRYQWAEAFAAASRSTNLLCGTLNTTVLLTSSLGVAAALLLAE